MTREAGRGTRSATPLREVARDAAPADLAQGATRAASRVPRPVDVRPATLSDLETVIELRLALLREHESHPVYGRLRADAEAPARHIFAAQIASDGETILLALVDGNVVGIMRCVDSPGSPLLRDSRYCYVSSVYVRPEMRRSGVLRALFARANAWCSERGLHEMRLHNVPSNPDAAAAWDALGFDVVEHVRLKRL